MYAESLAKTLKILMGSRMAAEKLRIAMAIESSKHMLTVSLANATVEYSQERVSRLCSALDWLEEAFSGTVSALNLSCSNGKSTWSSIAHNRSRTIFLAMHSPSMAYRQGQSLARVAFL